MINMKFKLQPMTSKYSILFEYYGDDLGAIILKVFSGYDQDKNLEVRRSPTAYMYVHVHIFCR